MNGKPINKRLFATTLSGNHDQTRYRFTICISALPFHGTLPSWMQDRDKPVLEITWRNAIPRENKVSWFSPTFSIRSEGKTTIIEAARLLNRLPVEDWKSPADALGYLNHPQRKFAEVVYEPKQMTWFPILDAPRITAKFWTAEYSINEHGDDGEERARFVEVGTAYDETEDGARASIARSLIDAGKLELLASWVQEGSPVATRGDYLGDYDNRTGQEKLADIESAILASFEQSSQDEEAAQSNERQ